MDINRLKNMIDNKAFSRMMFVDMAEQFTVDKDTGLKSTSFKVIENRDRLMAAKERFEACDVSGSVISDGIANAPAKGASCTPLFSTDFDVNQNYSAAKELYAIVDYYTDAFKNRGRTKDKRELPLKDFFQEVLAVNKLLNDNYAIGGALGVTTQSIVWAATEVLPTEPDFHQMFTIPMQIKAGEIVGFPAIQLNVDGGLDYAGTQELLTVNFGEDYEALATMSQSGVAVHLTFQEMERCSYDLLSMMFTAAKNALISWKAMKAINLIHNNAVTDFDNLDPAGATHGMTSGISIVNGGVKNMTLAMKDIMKIHVDGINRTHDYSIGIISPEAWMAIMQMPELKEYMEKNSLVWFPHAMGATGTVGRAGEPTHRKFVDPGKHNAQYNHLKPQLPGGFTNIQMTWIVTRHVPTFHEGDAVYKNYSLSNASKKSYYRDGGGAIVKCGKDALTSIYLLDPKNAVVYAEQKAMSMIDKEDEFREYYRAHFREGYAFHALRQGEAIRAIRNIAIVNEPNIDITKHLAISFTEATDILNK